jgi:YfiH family protein
MSFEERTIGRRGSVLVSTTMERAGFLVAFTGRTGGGSAGPFDSLNLSQVVGDDDAAVRANRATVVSELRLAGPFALAEQVHGSVVADAGPSGAGAGFDEPGRRIPGADAIVTRTAGVPVAVLTADCLPVALASPSAGVLAVVHAGWRGLAARILARAIAAFEGATDVQAAIGPAIGPDHYEVGEDVAGRVDAASPGGALTERRDGRLFLDLAGTAEATLRHLGVAGVEAVGRCTACRRDWYFSHRAEGGVTGRQALVAERR